MGNVLNLNPFDCFSMQKIVLFLFLWLPIGLIAQKTNPPAGSGKAPAKTSSPTKSASPAPASNAPVPKPATATATARDTAITRLFEKPAEIKWVKNFKGRLDDASVVDISLGFDGRNCRGYLTYAKSRIRFQLSGTLDTSGFVLQERDLSRNVTGQLKGTLQNKHLEADWTNTDNSLGSKLEAEEVLPGQTMTLNCSDNKWSSRYITRYNGARCDMILVRTHNGGLDGFLWVESDGRTYRLKGEIKNNNSFEMEVLGSADRLAAILSGKMAPGQNAEVNWVGSGERRTFKFTLKDHFLLGCYEYADYATSYDVLYPRTPCPSCNTQLDEQMNKWIERCQTTFNEKKMNLDPGSRARQRASAWPEIASWTDLLFTGYITFSDTWNAQPQGISFNYDLRTNKELLLDDLFNKGFNAKQYLSDCANREMPKLPGFAVNPKYRERVSKE